MARKHSPRSRKSRAKGRTAEEQFTTAQHRVEASRARGGLKLDLGELTKLAYLPTEIANLTELRHLTLDGTRISDFSQLGNFTALETLSLDRTSIGDLSPIAGLTNLRYLALSGTRVTDLAPVAEFTALQHLSLVRTDIGDLAPIASLTALKELQLNYTHVTDLSPISGLVGLQELWLGDTLVSDLYPIAELAALRVLLLDSTQARDFTPISGLRTLQQLSLDDTQIATLSVAARLTMLRKLWLNRTHVSDLSPISGLTALQGLGLNGTSVSDLSPLVDLTALQMLFLDRTPISDLTPIVGLVALQSLSLNATQVGDLSPIAGMTVLQDTVALTQWGGLNYTSTPIARQPPFDQLVELEQPARTVETINALRQYQGLSAHFPRGYERQEELPGPREPTQEGPRSEPLSGIPSAFGFSLSAGKITLASSPASWPVFPLPTSQRDHNNRLDVCRTLAADLTSDLASGKFNARTDYAQSLTRYVERLPGHPGEGNILLADAEARTLRNMFAAEADSLSVGLGSKLKTILEQHIGLRVYYPEIEHFYRDVQTGRIETPLPLDAVQEFVRGVGDHTPAVFDPTARDAIAGSAAPSPATAPPPAPTGSPVDPNQPAPPPDPLGEIDPRKARDFTFAGAVNNLWKAFREGEKVHKALDGWKKAGETLQPSVRRILEWLRDFSGPGDGSPPVPPGIGV